MDQNPKQKKVLTLCIIHDHPRVLLGLKKKGFGAGLWNGFGGKVEPGESIEDAAMREVMEESGLEVTNLEKHGILEFTFEDDKRQGLGADVKILEVHVFKAHDYVGEPQETDEMRPQWFYIDEIPFKEMWADDVYWVPLLLKDRKFRGSFHFDKPSAPDVPAKILDRKLALVDEI